MFAALLQVVAPIPAALPTLPPVVSGILWSLLEQAIPYVLTGIFALTMFLGGLLGRYILTHQKVGRIRHAELALIDSARVGVDVVAQTMADKARDPVTGKLRTDVDKAELLAAGLKAGTTWLAVKALPTIRADLDMTDEQLAEALKIQIESTIKNDAKIAEALVVIPPVVPMVKEVRTLPSGRKIVVLVSGHEVELPPEVPAADAKAST